MAVVDHVILLLGGSPNTRMALPSAPPAL